MGDTRKLYTLATRNGWKHDSVIDLISQNFKKQSTKDLTDEEYGQVMMWLETLPPNTVTTRRDPNTLDLGL